jgi:hypothetical protein
MPNRPAIHLLSSRKSTHRPLFPDPLATVWRHTGLIIKDKLFVFDYQGTRQTNGVSGTFTVPTATVLNTCNPATNTTGFAISASI